MTETDGAIDELSILEKVKTKDGITVTLAEILGHFKRGKAYFYADQFRGALREFEAVLSVAPGNIETRIWIRKAKQKLAEPGIEVTAEGEAAPATEEVKPKYCIWMSMGMVSYHICTHNYDCLTCEFDQIMHEKLAGCEAPELDNVSQRFELPGNQRLCRYAIRGDVSYRLCTRAFQCETCEFGQVMEDAIQQKLAKLAARREALRKKKQPAVAKA